MFEMLSFDARPQTDVVDYSAWGVQILTYFNSESRGSTELEHARPAGLN